MINADTPEEYTLTVSEIAERTATPPEEVERLGRALRLVVGFDTELLLHPRLERKIAELKSRRTYRQFFEAKTRSLSG
jgi:hypothetical protein